MIGPQHETDGLCLLMHVPTCLILTFSLIMQQSLRQLPFCHSLIYDDPCIRPSGSVLVLAACVLTGLLHLLQGRVADWEAASKASAIVR